MALYRARGKHAGVVRGALIGGLITVIWAIIEINFTWSLASGTLASQNPSFDLVWIGIMGLLGTFLGALIGRFVVD